MPTITLKDIPRSLHGELKRRAAAHHRSLNKEVLATLEIATAQTERDDVDAVRQQARESRGHFKRAIRVSEIAAWKRTGRP